MRIPGLRRERGVNARRLRSVGPKMNNAASAAVLPAGWGGAGAAANAAWASSRRRLPTSVPLDIHGRVDAACTLEGARAQRRRARGGRLSNIVTPCYPGTMAIRLRADDRTFAAFRRLQRRRRRSCQTRRSAAGKVPGRRGGRSPGAGLENAIAISHSRRRQHGAERVGRETPSPVIYFSDRDRPSQMGEDPPAHAPWERDAARAGGGASRGEPTRRAGTSRELEDHVDKPVSAADPARRSSSCSAAEMLVSRRSGSRGGVVLRDRAAPPRSA